MVHVHIADSGPGISVEGRRHLFEPFYTTKDVGKGTGLGLSICFGIVSDHDGRIWLNEEVSEGTEFVVALPHTDEIPAHSAAEPIAEAARNQPAGAAGRR